MGGGVFSVDNRETGVCRRLDVDVEAFESGGRKGFKVVPGGGDVISPAGAKLEAAGGGRQGGDGKGLLAALRIPE